MSDETKRDVLEKLAECYAEVSDAYTSETGSPYYCGDEPNYLEEYGTSLPDNLPVIPAGVGQGIAKMKSRGFSFLGALNYALNVTMTEWLSEASNQELFIRAWVLGVWSVEETGEIVKLEEEK
ncbi:hypothetical protein [Lacticaseibacillus rhamnosus]|uniref:hypothetical protein n=1 Tax=Lacticaseibacillus rhamnosus TaxID=47715 RepID=UPI0019120E63|nr:hypothetical protein [Lacticaseibacillus rhamnosus]